MRRFIPHAVLALLAACQPDPTPTGASPFGVPSSATAAKSVDPGTSLSNGIRVFHDAASFHAVLRTSTVATVSQDLSQSGSDLGGGTFELQLGPVRIRMSGPAFYGSLLGIDVLSKGVPVTLFFPSGAQGAGVDIAQLSSVKVTARARDGGTLVLDNFSNGGMGFLGFASDAGIEAIELTDPVPADTSTPITNLADITFGETGLESLPLGCDVLRERRPAVRVQVQGREVTVTAVARGVGVPTEVNVGPVVAASVGRFRFWPDGRHRGPRLTSGIFRTIDPDDFPVEVQLVYEYPEGAAAGEIEAAFDYELLSACYEEATGALEVGGLDEFGTCRPGEFVILQCDRGLRYAIP
jgi:hypothetical protein